MAAFVPRAAATVRGGHLEMVAAYLDDR